MLLLLGACASDGGGASRRPRKPVDMPPPEALIGVSTGALRALLGEPALLRREPLAEVWQYPGASCVVFFYFYETEVGAAAVSFIDARAKSTGPAPVAECLAEAAEESVRRAAY